MRLSKNISIMLLILAINSCGRLTDKDDNAKDNPSPTIALYDGVEEGRDFYNICTKAEKSPSDLYLIEMASRTVGVDYKNVNCLKLTKEITSNSYFLLMLMHDDESFDFSTIAQIKSIKSYEFFDVDFSKTKNIESLKNIDSISYNSTGIGEPIDFKVIKNMHWIKNIYFKFNMGGAITDLMPLKDLGNIEYFGLYENRQDEDALKFFTDRLKITKANCPIDAKSKAIADFCVKYAK